MRDETDLYQEPKPKEWPPRFRRLERRYWQALYVSNWLKTRNAVIDYCNATILAGRKPISIGQVYKARISITLWGDQWE